MKDETSKTDTNDKMEMHHEINGVATDMLVHIQDLIEDDSEIPVYAKKLSEKTGISIERATELINYHLKE